MRSLKPVMFALALLIGCATTVYAALPSDSTTTEPTAKSGWIKQLAENGFNLDDPKVHVPRFPRFVIKTYLDIDRAINTVDSSYVHWPGKLGKVIAHSHNWAESYLIDLGNHNLVFMNSDLYSDLGITVDFTLLSLSYTTNANELFRAPVAKRETFDLSFSCAKFIAKYYTSSTSGGTTISRFAQFNDGKHINYRFNNSRQKLQSAEMFYFFNYKRYSHVAAYNFSNHQLISAGSWILGLRYNYTNIGIDFTGLPDDMLSCLPEEAPRSYSLNYNDYCIAGGYGYNWVLKPRRWLINATALPGIGLKHLRNSSAGRRKDMFAANMSVKFAAVYYHKAMFAALNATFDGGFYAADNYSFFNSHESFSISVGFWY